jgi:predicted enzyme related to lactoylglutathione lyase
MNRVVHFEIYAAAPARAAEFYKQVFGWKIEPWGPLEAEYWHISTGEEAPGIDGGLWRRRGPAPVDGVGVNAYTCTIDVDNIDHTLEKIKGAGGSIAIEKNHIPGVGWLAYGKDTEGNMFGVIQR